MALGDLFPALIWRSRCLSNWHFQTSQTTGWGQALASIAIAIVALILQVFFGIELLVGHWYGVAAVVLVFSLYKIGEVTYILFLNPVPTNDREFIEESVVLQQPAGSPLSLEENSLYHHEQLKTGAFTRLLILKPALSDSAELQGEIIQFFRGTPVYYQALSYACGPRSDDDYISISDKKLPLTANCSVALRRLRHRVKARMLWVDSVCIDQKNLQEKVTQLRCMEMVYSYSAETLVWLGNESKGSLIAFQYLRLAGLSLHLPHQVSEWLVTKICRKILSRHHSHYIYSLYKRPWFRRIWTLQEVALSREQRVRLLCGSYETNFEWIAWPLTQLTGNLSIAEPYIYDSSALFAGFLLRCTTRNSLMYHKDEDKHLLLSHLLVKLQDHEAREAEDRIYSLLAIFVKAGIYDFPEPSYAKSVGRIYWDAMVTICNHEKSLHLLLLRTEKRREDMMDVPSWVPDFRVPGTPKRRLGLTFAATANSTADFTISLDQKKLSTTIFVVDVVSNVSRHTVWQPTIATPYGTVQDSITTNLEEGFEQTISALRDWLWMLMGPTGYKNRYDPKGSELVTFRETLLCGTKLVPDSREVFDNWLTLLLHQDPKMKNTKSDTRASNEKVIQDFLLEHAYPLQILRDRFFDHSAPFLHLTNNILWQIMCCFKTVPCLKETHHHIWSMTRGGSRFFVTKEGFMGLGPSEIKNGDSVVLVPGLGMPLILRQVIKEEKEKNVYEVIGVAYVQDLMDGHYWQEMKWGKRTVRTESVVLI